MTPYHPESLIGPSQAKTSASTNTLAPWEPIKGLSQVHMEIVRLHVMEGKSVSRINYQLKRYNRGLSGTHIRRILDSPSGRRYASFLSAQLHGGTPGLVTAMEQHLPGAVFVQTEIMYDPLEQARHRLAAADSILDRGGLPKISRQENDAKLPQNITINILPSQHASFAAPPPVIEAEIVPLLDAPSSDNSAD